MNFKNFIILLVLISNVDSIYLRSTNSSNYNLTDLKDKIKGMDTIQTGKSAILIKPTFKSNSLRPIYPQCNDTCLLTNIWNGQPNLNDFLIDNSNGSLQIDLSLSNIVSVDMDLFASTLGCVTSQYKQIISNKLLETLGLDISNYYYQFVMLPDQAGGGACARYKSISTGACIGSRTSCPVFFRTNDASGWISGLTLGLGGYNTNDMTDATNNGWRRYSAITRYNLKMLPENSVRFLTNNTIQTVRVNLYSSSLKAVEIKGIQLINYKQKFFISLRTVENDTYDKYLPPEYGNQVYIHDPLGNLLYNVSVGGKYTDFTNDFNLNFVQIDNSVGSLDINYCNSRSLQPNLLTTSVSNVKNNFTTLELEVTNPSKFCADKSQIFRLNQVDGLPTCNLISVVLVPDINRNEIAYEIRNSLGEIIIEGGSEGKSILYCGDYGEPLTASFYDYGGDGYCCFYGGGSYYQLMVNNQIVKRGGVFNFVDIVNFDNVLFWSVNSLQSNTTKIYSIDIPMVNYSSDATYQFSLVGYSNSKSSTVSISPTISPSLSWTSSLSDTPTITPTISFSPSLSSTQTTTKTLTKTPSKTLTSSKSLTSSRTASRTGSPTGSPTGSLTGSLTGSPTSSRSISPSRTVTKTKSISKTKTKSKSKSKSFTKSRTRSNTRFFK